MGVGSNPTKDSRNKHLPTHPNLDTYSSKCNSQFVLMSSPKDLSPEILDFDSGSTSEVFLPLGILGRMRTSLCPSSPKIIWR